MSALDQVLTGKRLAHFAASSVWQLIVGLAAIGLAFAYVEHLMPNPARQEAELKAREDLIRDALEEKGFCNKDTSSEKAPLVEMMLEHGANVVPFNSVENLISESSPQSKVGQKRQKEPRGADSICGVWQWTHMNGSILPSDTKNEKFEFKETAAITSWAMVNFVSKHKDSQIVFIEERGPLEGRLRQAILWAGAGLVVLLLLASYRVSTYLHSRLDRLSEFSRRMSFVLHDLRHNLERIRASARAGKAIDPLVSDSERLIEGGRAIANIQQEPPASVELHGLLVAALEGAYVEVDCPAGLTVRVPPRSFRAAIGNLLSNAKEHGSPDGESQVEVAVSVRRRRGWPGWGNEAVVAIADNGPGPGLRIERSERIGEAIKRIQGERGTSQRRGLGLLSVLYAVQDCGGTFALLDREDGRSGSVAEMVIPAKRGSA